MCLQTFQHLKRLLISVTAVSYCCYKRISDCNKRVKRGTYWNCSSCSLLSSGRLRPRPAAPPHADGALVHHAGGGGALGDQRSGLRHHAAPPRGGTWSCTQHTQLHHERRENLTRWKQRMDFLFVVFQRLNSALFFFLFQGFSATRSCWRCLKRTSSCGCCGEAAEPPSTNQIATTSSTSSSLRCHGNWSRHPKPRR